VKEMNRYNLFIELVIGVALLLVTNTFERCSTLSVIGSRHRRSALRKGTCASDSASQSEEKPSDFGTREH
jgi:hypothetical protein